MLLTKGKQRLAKFRKKKAPTDATVLPAFSPHASQSEFDAVDVCDKPLCQEIGTCVCVLRSPSELPPESPGPDAIDRAPIAAVPTMAMTPAGLGDDDDELISCGNPACDEIGSCVCGHVANGTGGGDDHSETTVASPASQFGAGGVGDGAGVGCHSGDSSEYDEPDADDGNMAAAAANDDSAANTSEPPPSRGRHDIRPSPSTSAGSSRSASPSPDPSFHTPAASPMDESFPSPPEKAVAAEPPTEPAADRGPDLEAPPDAGPPPPPLPPGARGQPPMFLPPTFLPGVVPPPPPMPGMMGMGGPPPPPPPPPMPWDGTGPPPPPPMPGMGMGPGMPPPMSGMGGLSIVPGGLAGADGMVVTKKLHWKVVPQHALQNTVWSSLPVTGATDDPAGFGGAQIDVEKFKTMFTAEQKPARPVLALRRKKKPAGVKFGETQRMNNVSIGLKRFEKLVSSHAELVEAIVDMDESVFGIDDLYMLKRVLPNADELKNARGYRGAANALGAAERFFLVVSKQQFDLHQVCESFIFILEYQEKLDEVTRDVQALTRACDEVQSSRCLKALLGKALELGNLTNSMFAPASRRQAVVHGFSIESLEKLKDIKSPTNRNMDLLQFLVQTVRADAPALLKVRDEVSHLETARHCDVALLTDEMARLKEGLQQLRSQHNQHSTAVGPGGQWPETLSETVGDFLGKSAATFATLVTAMAAASAAAKATLAFFGEPAETKPAQLFTRLFNFVQAF